MTLIANDVTTASLSPAAPPLRYAGGKRALIPIIAPGIQAYLNKTGGRYIEPFLGGGAIALYLGSTPTAPLRRMLLSDANTCLMETYRMIRNQPTLMLGYLEALFSQDNFNNTVENYQRIREEDSSSIPFERAARMIYLNMTSFNGLWRVNKKGKYNVPIDKTRVGKDMRPAFERISNRVMAASNVLAQSELECCDFWASISRARSYDLIYADSPYDGTTFTSYTADQFDAADQERLSDSLRHAHDKGAEILASNADTPLVRRLYDWATLIPTGERRSINSDGAARGKVGCVLITTDEGLVTI